MKFFYLFCLLLILFTPNISAQSHSSPPDTASKKLQTYQQHHPSEKVYLHLDKNIYAPSETIWFKAYMVDGSIHLPGSLSTLLYVELWSPLQTLIAKRNIFVAGGVGKGDIELPDSLATGVYHIKAYTRYMLNNDTAFIFNEPIHIVGENEPPALAAVETIQLQQNTTTTPALPSPLQLQFFPEGGELVNGLQNRMGIKAGSGAGESLDIKGKIINNRGDTTSWFNTYKFGLGDVLLQPSLADAPYSAVVNYKGTNFYFMLPEVKDSGSTLSARTHSNKIYIKAVHTDPEDIKGAYILGHIRGRVFTTIEAEPGAKEIYAALPTDSLPPGIAHFTLFNKEGIPQRERLVFISHPDKRTRLSVKTDQQSYDTREEANFQLHLRDHRGEAISGNVSATIIDKSLLEEGGNKPDNIRSFFLLSSDMKGTIENPAYYFNPANKDRLYLLDLLMLTHGWRKFTWKEVLEAPATSPAILPEVGFTINGQLFKYYRREKEQEGIVQLRPMEDLLFSKSDTTSEDGKFSFQGLHFMDTVTVILQADKAGKKNNKGNDAIYIAVDSAGIHPLRKERTSSIPTRNPSLQESPVAGEYQDKISKIKEIDAAYALEEGTVLLEEVAVDAKKEKKDDPFDRPGMMYHHPTKRLIPDSISSSTAFRDVFDMLQGSMPGVKIVGTGLQKSVLIRNTVPVFVLDGMLVDHSIISMIPPSYIAFVDIVREGKTAIYGLRGNNTVIAVYTRRHSDDVNVKKEVPGIINFKHPGYYLAREFYTPNYHKDDPSHAKPDFRSTLYWNPDIFIDEDGEAEIKFFTSDEKEEYILLIEGITADGRFITGEKSFQVK
ncbi:TonB-dependent receptor plug domain-containing protein [Nafulsella turpanensis]|uniref:TonB-dependent receptor plug domain-containing protein n=1 Tax=Nafulsella turpanensis TaxID=1265690 RepID=UPI00034B16F1|nr:TonB-dependent receptor plug domain-containing protein [Nafulsella turpanensis]